MKKKMKKILLLFCISSFLISCQKDDLDIPRDEKGNAVLTDVSSATTTGISTLDNAFTVTTFLPNAKAGDQIKVECLQLQYFPEGGNDQLLPLNGTQKTVNVGNDFKATVSYSREEVNLNKAGDFVTVTFAGKTDAAIQRIEMVTATKVSKPKVGNRDVDIMRTDETAYFHVTVEPKSEEYSGELIAKRKNGRNEEWEDVEGSPFSGEQPFLVPIKGTDFEIGKDTMYYSFSASQNSYTDEIVTSVIVRDPYFFLKKSNTLTLGSGINLLVNEKVAKNDENAMLALSDDLMLKGGSTWLSKGNSIQFVPATALMYSINNSNDAIAAFEEGSPTETANPAAAEGVYIFKAVTGPNPEDIYYGMISITDVKPGSSVTFEYRIGNLYAQLTKIK
jgi:hypothetical protein